MKSEYRYGYRNKNTKTWAWFKALDKDGIDFHPDVLYLAKNVLMDEFGFRCIKGIFKRDEWELVKIKVTYEEEEITNE